MNVRLTEDQKIHILNSDDLYPIMREILLRENKIGREKEHMWTVSLSSANQIINIELSALGSVKQVNVEPMDIFRLALIKGAAQVILVHNHPSGNTKPSEADLDITDRMFQVGQLVGVTVLDHLIITENDFLSFAGAGLMDKVALSKKFQVHDDAAVRAIQTELKHEQWKAEKKKTREQAKQMKADGLSDELIAKYTGLTPSQIKKL